MPFSLHLEEKNIEPLKIFTRTVIHLDTGISFIARELVTTSLMILYSQKWKVSSVTAPVHVSFESSGLEINGPVPTILATIY